MSEEKNYCSADDQYDCDPYQNGNVQDIEAPYTDPHAIYDLALSLVKVDHDGGAVYNL